MESKKNLVLLGFMGSGKSTIGSILANKLNLDFIDVDYHLEKEEGISISKIFSAKGESYFRKIEEKISIKLLKLNNKVISLGGGGFINSNIQRLVLKDGISFWLKWNSLTLINRVKRNKKRPLIININEKKLKKLIRDRSEAYNKAHYKIDCENLNKNEIVNKISDIYENK